MKPDIDLSDCFASTVIEHNGAGSVEFMVPGKEIKHTCDDDVDHEYRCRRKRSSKEQALPSSEFVPKCFCLFMFRI